MKSIYQAISHACSKMVLESFHFTIVADAVAEVAEEEEEEE